MASTPTGTLYRGREGMWSWVAHRVTGVLIFFFLLFAHVLDTALVRVSPEAYNDVIGTYKNPSSGSWSSGWSVRCSFTLSTASGSCSSTSGRKVRGTSVT